MQRAPSPALSTHLQTIKAFVQRHWLDAGRNPQTWCNALRIVGWTVPHWPIAQGGCGWSELQYYHWLQCCIRNGAPTGDHLSLHGIGPLLQVELEASLDHPWLQDIGQWRSTWCLAVPDPLWPAEQPLSLLGSPGNWCVSGTVAPVLGLLQADWALCLLPAAAKDSTQPFALIAIDLTGPGVQRRGLAGLTEVSAVDHSTPPSQGELRLAKVPLPASTWVTSAATAGALLNPLRAFAPALDPQRISSAALALELADLAQLNGENPDAEADVQAHAQLRIDLLALEVLEQRLLGLSPADPSAKPLALMQQQRAIELQASITDAQVAALGYYLLPFEDPIHSHNEGSVGPPLARAKVAALLESRGLAAAFDSVAAQHSEMTTLLGLSADQSSHKDAKKP
ncbi:MAG: hypothetical protein ACR2PZ_09605 [Pseudomonadales bacterium]